MLNKKQLANKLASARRNAKRRTVKVKAHTRAQYSLPKSLWRVNQGFRTEEAILAIGKSIKRSSRTSSDFVIVAMLQEAVNTIRKELQ